MCRTWLEGIPLVLIIWMIKLSNGGSGEENMKQEDMEPMGHAQEQGAPPGRLRPSVVEDIMHLHRFCGVIVIVKIVCLLAEPLLLLAEPSNWPSEMQN